ncbi:MAG: TraB/GumN family protein [Deltaproteobacteria bacterium]|nr:TraB/GumN family protein [Deltaproteobacteria bacterium]
MFQRNSVDNENVQRLTLDGREIILIGTAHVSRESADLVIKVISEERPDVVCVELCKARLDAIRQRDKWHETDIVKVIREKRASLLLSQLLMVSFQKKIAQKFNIKPGEEMIRAVGKAEEIGAEVVLADREVRITLLRAWRMMSFWSKMKVVPELILSLFIPEEITEEDIEKLKRHDMLEVALRTVGEKLPDLKTTLIDERDQYLAHTIGHAPGRKIVVVVGAGHVPGIVKNLGVDIDIEKINQIPPPSLWSKLAGWVFSGAIIGLFVAGFFYSGSQASMSMIKWWVVITATCSGLGALLLLAHPLTIAASAIAAPITTLHPLIAAGWVAGLTEATVRKPQVRDFLDLSDDITSIRGFFRNKITRILLLVAFVNVTTSIGTFIAIPVMMRFF